MTVIHIVGIALVLLVVAFLPGCDLAEKARMRDGMAVKKPRAWVG